MPWEYDGPWDDIFLPFETKEVQDVSEKKWTWATQMWVKQARCGFQPQKTQWTTNKCDVCIFLVKIIVRVRNNFSFIPVVWRKFIPRYVWFPNSSKLSVPLCPSLNWLRNIAALPNALKLPVTVPQPAVVFQLHERWCLPKVHWYGYESKPWQPRYPKIGGYCNGCFFAQIIVVTLNFHPSPYD